MADITLLELHPDGDVQFGPRSLRGSESETTVAEQTTDEPAADEGGSSKLPLLLGILFVGFVAFAAMKLLSEDSEDELADLDES